MANPIKPFRIAVPQSDLDDLAARLTATRWPDDLPGAGWDYGVPLPYLRDLVTYWRTGYDWRLHEAALNAFPQFTTRIDGAHVHFLHVRSPEPDALPLILTHGWPGSIVEFQNLIGPLTDPRSHGADPADAFHVIIPSTPGYGFSGPTQDKHWDYHRVAAAWIELMSRLGYERYGAQGGDWGSGISRQMGVLAPERLLGIHLNSAPTYPDGDGDGLDELDSARLQTWLVTSRRPPATPPSRPPALTPSPTPSPTHPSGNWPGSWRSSRSGPTPPAPPTAPSTATAS